MQQQRPEHEVRLEKFEKIKARDGVVFKDKFTRTHTIKQAQGLQDDAQASLCGRITALRWFGKLVFGRLYDAEGEIQFSVSKNDLDEEGFAFFKDYLIQYHRRFKSIAVDYYMPACQFLHIIT